MSSPQPEQPRPDPPSITADGIPLTPLIDGVVLRQQRPIEDRRGEVLEVYRPSWGVHPDPVSYTHLTLPTNREV